MAARLAFIALAAPPALFALLLAVPGLDAEWGTASFHFYVVTAASFLAAGACGVLVLSARSIRETRILFLALSFFALSMIFAVHGLTTPGFIFDKPYAAVERSPYISTLAAGFFATLSVISIPRFMEHTRLRLPDLTFAVCAGLVCVYVLASLAAPNWLEGFPTRREWFRDALSALTIGLLCFAGWRYFQSYRFTRLPGQLAVTAGLFFLAEAQVSLNFGELWYYSWWLYHGLFLAAFSSVLAGWTWELVRAGDARAIAEAIAMRDALSQFNRGRTADLVTLADQIENHDLETFRHVDRVAAFAYAIGRELNFGAARLRDLVLAAQMHDIGKIGLPPYILTKPGKLTDDEFAQVKLHPGKGYEIVTRVKSIEGLASLIRHHHERFDGAGYPDSLAGEAIPLEARIIAVADTFDALTSQRPYRPAMSIPDARAELLRVSGAQLDPACVETLLKLIDAGTLKPRSVPQAALPVAP